MPVVRSHEHSGERMRVGAGANRTRALHRFASDTTSCSGAVSTPIRTRVVAGVALRFAVAMPLVDRPSLCSGIRTRRSLPLPRSRRQSAARRRIRTREKSGDIRRLRVDQLLERTYVDSTDQPTARAPGRSGRRGRPYRIRHIFRPVHHLAQGIVANLAHVGRSLSRIAAPSPCVPSVAS